MPAKPKQENFSKGLIQIMYFHKKLSLKIITINFLKRNKKKNVHQHTYLGFMKGNEIEKLGFEVIFKNTEKDTYTYMNIFIYIDSVVFKVLRCQERRV